MQLSDFDYYLPAHLIAKYPPAQRGESRLLHVAGESLDDLMFDQLLLQMNAGDVMVLNDTRVVKARLFGEKSTGGKVEALVERVIENQVVLAHVRASKPPKVGARLIFAGRWQAEMEERVGELFKLRFLSDDNVFDIMEAVGELPLPPYLGRPVGPQDQVRYQTVYARELGAVAAPTAGLHFSEEMLAALEQKGVHIAWITLHVGAGTFQPVRVEHITDHKMHREVYDIPRLTCDLVAEARRKKRKVLAVGTTSMRALEAAASQGNLTPGRGETDIFITPGYCFKVVDRLLTNYHLPKSTLLILVAAFAGLKTIQRAYQHAIAQQYRFYSYGDTMLLERQQSPD